MSWVSFYVEIKCFLIALKITLKCFKILKINSRNYEGKAYQIEDFHTILNHESFNRERATTIYSYGFTQTLFNPSVRDVVDAYLFNGDFNFMVISCDKGFAYNIFVSNCCCCNYYL